jgi:hypothetical protein
LAPGVPRRQCHGLDPPFSFPVRLADGDPVENKMAPAEDQLAIDDFHADYDNAVCGIGALENSLNLRRRRNCVARGVTGKLLYDGDEGRA